MSGGAGKSTAAALLVERLAALGLPVLATTEPSRTELGDLVRTGTDTYDGLTFACLVAADRYHHLEAEVRPALERGLVVVCDRYLASSLVLQRMDGVEEQWWELPGGGLADGEDTVGACRRELAEETGITGVEIGPVVWERESWFRYRGREHHRFDWVHVGHLAGGGCQARSWTANEKTTVLGERWWSLPELRAARRERFLPRRLAALLPDVLTGRHQGVTKLYEDTR